MTHIPPSLDTHDRQPLVEMVHHDHGPRVHIFTLRYEMTDGTETLVPVELGTNLSTLDQLQGLVHLFRNTGTFAFHAIHPTNVPAAVRTYLGVALSNAKDAEGART